MGKLTSGYRVTWVLIFMFLVGCQWVFTHVMDGGYKAMGIKMSGGVLPVAISNQSKKFPATMMAHDPIIGSIEWF